MLTAATQQVINAPEVVTYHLFEIYYDDASNPLCWTDHSEQVVYDAKTYEPFAIKMGEIKMDGSGKVSPVTLSIGNVDEDRIIQQYIENYNLVGKHVRVMQIFEGAPDIVEYFFRIKSANATKGVVSFTLGLGFDILLSGVPNRTIFQRFCRFQFKDENCKYAGGATSCGRLWEDCLELGNTINFGGFPGITNSRLYF